MVNRTLHPPQSLQPSQSAHPNQSSDVHGLNNRVKALEAALQAALSGDRGTVDKEAILRSVGVGDPVVQDEVGEAAMALGELAMSRGGQQFHGPGSVASFLASTFQPGSSAPRARSYLFFGEAATSVIQAFPPRAVCHHLKELFFSFHNMSLRFNVTPQVVFENLLRELLDYRDAVVLSPELALPLPNTLSFVGLASIVCQHLPLFQTKSEANRLFIPHFSIWRRHSSFSLRLQSRSSLNIIQASVSWRRTWWLNQKLR